jgi:hypothetical protein
VSWQPFPFYLPELVLETLSLKTEKGFHIQVKSEDNAYFYFEPQKTISLKTLYLSIWNRHFTKKYWSAG